MRQAASTVKKVGARARRQRAVHRLRRRRSRRGGRGRDRLEVPQHGPDLRLRQPHLRPGRGLRRLRREARRSGDEAEGRPRHRGRRRCRARSINHGRGREGRAATSPTPSASGARVVVGGKRHALGGTLLRADGADRRHRRACSITREETFGPVAPLFRFKDEAEAIELANATEFGLAAYFYARDIGRVWRVAEALEYGMVGINTGAHLDRGRALRRGQGIGHRPRGLALRHRGVRRGQIHADGRARSVKVSG